MSPFTAVGKPTPLIDAPRKASGAAEFVSDVRLPGLLEGKVLRSPHPHARILRVDVEAARRVPGVRAVVTGADAPTPRWGWTQLKDQSILAGDRVRFLGEEVAAVAAEDAAAALEAAERIRVEYEPLPAVFDPEEAMAEGAPLVHEKPRNIASEVHAERGDVESALREADVVREETYTTSFHYQAYMEPMGSVAKPEGAGRYTLWTPLQHPFLARDLIADALGLKREDLRLIQPFVGGAFGGKALEEPNAFITLLLAMKSGRPVRLLNTRTEEFTAARPRVPTRLWLRMSAKKDGRLLSKEARVIADNGASTGLADAILRTACYRCDNAYRIANLRSHGYLVYTNKIPTGAFRGFGNPQGTFAQESLLDVLAHEIGMDPADLRLKNAVRTGDVTVHGWRIGSCGLDECIRAATRAAGWEKARRAGGKGAVRRGVGLACAIHVSGNRMFADWDGSRAEVDLDAEGGVTVRTGEGDIGQGSRTVAAIVAAEELNVEPARIQVSATDTQAAPFCLGSYASRLALVAGHAVRLGAVDARDRLIPVAADLLEAAPEDVEWREGAFRVRGSSDRSLSLKKTCREAVSRNAGEPVRGFGEYDPPTEPADEKTLYGNIAAAYEFAAQVAEVEVDLETGRVRVVRITSADDVGRVLNPLAAHGQVEGAVVQGTGFALLEEIRVEGGQVINGNFGDYTLPKADTVPAVDSIMIESNDPYGPYGAKGASEAAIVPTAPAIANAIFHATGVRVTSLPITAEKLLAALSAKEG
ncbi:MAG: xanthine dehydrogenase family protein molybdopterin-binding subunit [Candidatus Tectomicrobia bacterium]|nr:xanthine dehydrogenase family protein molybdopterin-binding subunit [Candidatus Tectomicrobia bacterium]